MSLSKNPTSLTPSPPPQDFIPIVLTKVHVIVEKDFITSYNSFQNSLISHLIAHHPVPGEKDWEQRALLEHPHILQLKDKQLLYTILGRLKKFQTKENKSLPPHIFPLSFLNPE
jgi:hypothetical protein